MKLKRGEYIITAFAQSAAGPGWANTPLWVIVKGVGGSIREECIQPDERSADMSTLYTVSETVHNAMTSAVRRAWKERR